MASPPGLAGPLLVGVPLGPGCTGESPLLRPLHTARRHPDRRAFRSGDRAGAHLAEQPEHALAELLQRFRGKPLRRGHLRRRDPRRSGAFVPLALVDAWLPSGIDAQLPDLGDPAVLQRLGIRADHLASRERRITQAISRSLHERGLPGFRWWSALGGDWHVSVLFLDRVDVGVIVYGAPDPLSLDHPTVRATARLLHMPLRPGAD